MILHPSCTVFFYFMKKLSCNFPSGRIFNVIFFIEFIYQLNDNVKVSSRLSCLRLFRHPLTNPTEQNPGRWNTFSRSWVFIDPQRKRTMSTVHEQPHFGLVDGARMGWEDWHAGLLFRVSFPMEISS